MSRRITIVFLALFLLVIAVVAPQARAQTTVYYQPTPYPSTAQHGIHILDGWLPSVYYGQTFQADDRLQIGGWGDNYRTYIQFDLVGLPANVSSAELDLYAYPRGDSSTLVNFDAWSPNSAWASSNLTTSMTWSTQPASFSLVGSYATSSLNAFWGIGITTLYNNWKNGVATNNGITLMPWTQNNNFDVWRSSRYLADDTKRPKLRLVFTPPVAVPNFKMPLPRNVKWLVTTEAGGWDCAGSAQDSAHTGLNYFSVDFNWRNKNANGDQVYGSPADGANIPILASADGVVREIIDSDADPNFVNNGYFVGLSHDPSGNIHNGFSTRYLHMKAPPVVSIGQSVTQGQILGYMGSTGFSTGPHVHFGIRYNYDGSPNTNVMYAVVSGWLMKSFQTECVGGSPARYYMSN